MIIKINASRNNSLLHFFETNRCLSHLLGIICHDLCFQEVKIVISLDHQQPTSVKAKHSIITSF
jgi:hypothetical protein